MNIIVIKQLVNIFNGVWSMLETVIFISVKSDAVLMNYGYQNNFVLVI